MRRFDRILADRSPPERIVLAWGAEARAAELLVEAGARRVLLVASATRRQGADRLAAALGPRSAGVFAGVTVQVPRAVAQAATRQAEEANADWVVAHGGGSAIGVAKAVALARPVAVGAVPTTYAGSERTDIYGIVDGEGPGADKQTGRDPRVRPRLVVYDPALGAALPPDLALPSLLNALAHSVEALYAVQATEPARQAARDSLGPLLAGLRGIAAEPSAPEPRTEATYGAFLAGEALGGASMALHHKLAHVLGGSLGTAHAATHATLLPYTMAFNLPAAPQARQALCEAWQVADPAAFLHDSMRALGLPTSLRLLATPRGPLTRADLALAAERAASQRYPNPRAFDAAAVLQLLDDAWHDRRPSTPGS